MPKNYVEYNDANTVLGTYANAIKAATPIEITYAQFQQLTPQQQETGNYIVTDYPGSNLEVVDSVIDGDQRAVTSNAVYDKLAALFTIKKTKISDGVEIQAGNYAQIVSDANYAGKIITGYAVYSVGNYNVSVTQVYAESDAFHITIKNNGSADITTGQIWIWYAG